MIPDNLRSDMIALYEKTQDFHFAKKNYASDIEKLLSTEAELLQRTAEACDASDDNLQEIATYIPDYVAGKLEAIPSKRKRDYASLEYNLTMVSYFIPVMGKMPSLKAETLTMAMADAWNKRMPEYKIKAASAETIQNGFKGGLCYITTAVCKSLGKEDDCRELTLLRDYRDKYLMGDDSGRKIVEDYYDIAPTIVKRIDRSEDAGMVYTRIWNEYLNPCVKMIENGKKEECRILYTEMVKKLKHQYM